MKALVAEFSIKKEMWGHLKSKLPGRGARSGGLSLRMANFTEPALVSPQWVRIRTIMSGISDMDEGMILHQDPSVLGAFLSFPFVPGNENMGIVTEVGADVTDIEPGERVVVDPVLSCERRGIEPVCASCARGDPFSCSGFAAGTIGPGMMIGACRDTSGGWGDSFIAHRNQARVIPDHVESGAAIIAPEFARALRAVLQNPPLAQERIIVMGAGSLGLLTFVALNLFGWGPHVIIVADHAFEAEAASELGAADVIISNGRGTTYEEVAALVEGKVRYPEVGRISLQGGADLVYETTGCAGSIEDAVNFTAEGKRLVLLGVNGPGGVDPGPIRFKGVQISSAGFSGREIFNGRVTSTFDLAMDLLSGNALPWKRLISHKFHITDYAKAFAAIGNRAQSKALKVVFEHVM